MEGRYLSAGHDRHETDQPGGNRSAIAEVVERRYRRLVNEHAPFPDLVISDRGQNEPGLHVLVADRGGRSFVAELSASDKEWHFTDNAGKPQILTNHAFFKYPDTSAFPPAPATDEYDSFNRYLSFPVTTGHPAADCLLERT